MGLDVATKSPKSAAAGQYLGYAIQPVRLCYHLLTIDDGFGASLEFLDDVAVHRTDGSVYLEQCKSALKGNPVSDKANDLWKTFATWAEKCQAGECDVFTTDFMLYATPANSGAVIQAIAAAKTHDQAVAALEQIKTLIDKKKPEVGCQPFLLRFLAVGDDACINIIRRASFIAEANPLDGIRKILRATISEASVDDFCDTAIGQAKAEVERLIRDGKKPVVDAKGFRRRFQAFVRKHNLTALLPSTTVQPGSAQISSVIEAAPIFVRQLTAVNASSDLIVGAVSAFLRTSADKAKWAEDGLIVEDSLAEFDNGLKSHFVIVRDGIEDLYASSSDDARGRMLYRDCVKLTVPLEGRALPTHFVPGAFNMLADTRELGWHPKFEELLGEK